MNPFVNYQARDIELPEGCKNLIDVLELARRKQAPPPEGIADIQRYVARVLQSVATVRILDIFSLDYQINVIVGHHAKGVFPAPTLTLIVDCADPAREQMVRTLFDESAILPSMDMVATAPRILEYPIPVTAPAAAHLIAQLLQRVYGLAADAKLNFHYREHDAAS